MLTSIRSKVKSVWRAKHQEKDTSKTGKPSSSFRCPLCDGEVVLSLYRRTSGSRCSPAYGGLIYCELGCRMCAMTVSMYAQPRLVDTLSTNGRPLYDTLLTWLLQPAPSTSRRSFSALAKASVTSMRKTTPPVGNRCGNGLQLGLLKKLMLRSRSPSTIYEQSAQVTPEALNTLDHFWHTRMRVPRNVYIVGNPRE